MWLKCCNVEQFKTFPLFVRAADVGDGYGSFKREHLFQQLPFQKPTCSLKTSPCCPEPHSGLGMRIPFWATHKWRSLDRGIPERPRHVRMPGRQELALGAGAAKAGARVAKAAAATSMPSMHPRTKPGSCHASGEFFFAAGEVVARGVGWGWQDGKAVPLKTEHF